MSDWKIAFDSEMARAEQARQAGNQGMARVCARRAAGHVAGEYLQRCGLPNPNASAYDRLRLLCSRSEVPPAAIAAANRLLLRVTTGHTLPVEADLLADARLLRQQLLGA